MPPQAVKAERFIPKRRMPKREADGRELVTTPAGF
jgi:hypothetical protein